MQPKPWVRVALRLIVVGLFLALVVLHYRLEQGQNARISALENQEVAVITPEPTSSVSATIAPTKRVNSATQSAR